MRHSLWMGPDPAGPGARLLALEHDSGAARPVALVLRTPRPIERDGSVSIVELEYGGLEVEITDGRGWEVAVTLGPAEPTGRAAVEQFTTPSGRVNVQFGD